MIWPILQFTQYSSWINIQNYWNGTPDSIEVFKCYPKLPNKYEALDKSRRQNHFHFQNEISANQNPVKDSLASMVLVVLGNLSAWRPTGIINCIMVSFKSIDIFWDVDIKQELLYGLQEHVGVQHMCYSALTAYTSDNRALNDVVQ